MKAVARYVRIPPRKARLAVDLVRGKSIDEALKILAQLPNKSARIVQKVIESAVANAVHNDQIDPRWLYVGSAFVDEGPRWKRILPKDRGRAFRILKRTSHITVELDIREPRSRAPRATTPSKEEAN